MRPAAAVRPIRVPEGALAAGTAALYGWALLRVVSVRGSFGHDESAYALLARAWVEGTPPTGAGLQRAPLLPALATPVVAVTAEEWAFRLVGVLFGMGAVLAVWALTRQVFGGGGLLAAATLATAPSIQRRASEFLTDLPAAVLLTLAAGLLWREFAVRPRAGRGLLLFAPLAAAAFYLRYGSLLPIALLGLTALVLWPKRVLQPMTAAAGGAFLLLLIPHVLSSVERTGRPWGLVAFTTQVAGRDYLGQGLAEYVAWFPLELAGPLAGGLMGLGLLGTALVRTRPYLFCVLPALAQIVLIGLVSHGEPRFVFFPIMLLLSAGGGWVAELLGRLSREQRAAAVSLGAVLLLSGFAVASSRSVASFRGSSSQVVEAAAQVVSAFSDPPCTVVSSYEPQVTWYSGCATYDFAYVARRPGTDPDFLLLFEHGKEQPSRDALANLLGEAELVETVPDPRGAIGDGSIYELAD